MRFARPAERTPRQRRRASSVYLVSSGEVEIAHDGHRLHLGRGALFGGDGILGEVLTQGL